MIEKVFNLGHAYLMGSEGRARKGDAGVSSPEAPLENEPGNAPIRIHHDDDLQNKRRDMTWQRHDK
jgi:hypothetical protein